MALSPTAVLSTCCCLCISSENPSDFGCFCCVFVEGFCPHETLFSVPLFLVFLCCSCLPSCLPCPALSCLVLPCLALSRLFRFGESWPSTCRWTGRTSTHPAHRHGCRSWGPTRGAGTRAPATRKSRSSCRRAGPRGRWHDLLVDLTGRRWRWRRELTVGWMERRRPPASRDKGYGHPYGQEGLIC